MTYKTYVRNKELVVYDSLFKACYKLLDTGTLLGTNTVLIATQEDVAGQSYDNSNICENCE